LGQGSSGAGGTVYVSCSGLVAGRGGSGGCNGASGVGGNYGGGGGGGNNPSKSGAVRIIWPGNTRQFPSTCTNSP
jgi:hypothetical protein